MKHILDLKGGLRYGWISGMLKFFFFTIADLWWKKS